MLKRWPAFAGFLDDGRICLTNNAAERALRGIAIGRKAWLFAGSDRGGERAVAMFTLIETAKLNGIDPQAWLTDVLTRINDHPGRQARRTPTLEMERPDCQTGGMNPAGSSAAFDSFNEIATVRIELRDSDPVIWRQVEVPTSITLKVLHNVIQAAMGWFDYHLWEFTIAKRRYGLPMDQDWGTEPRTDASKVRLREVLRPRKTTIDYLYDFGDCWEHRLTVTDVRAGDPELSYPRYITGERNAPPEDCGGIPGFYETLDAATDPDHPNHAEAKEWLDDYDPDVFDELPIKYALSRVANQRNATRARLAKKKPQR